ncbi:unnamed protein product [Paramecium pentaurelia]|uniref:Uncharacterized protein n=1 Tax=Paramecium pentaurelia TaxID=43138 RepID=A0A8S1WVC9_9CILI|nr:unnamed protein product [Paramecium pentaurelia]
MFILVLFGYKQYKVFTIDVLGNTLLDCIWTQAIKEITKLLTAKDEQHQKDQKTAQQKISLNEKRISAINQQLQEEGLLEAPTGKKDDKKGAKPPPQKKGKDAPPSNPLEAEKLELQKDTEKQQEYVTKYTDKLNKIKVTLEKFKDLNEKYHNDQLVIELCDKTGERKFVKTKLDGIANTFLSDKGTYILAYLQAPATPDEEEQLMALEFEGYLARTVDEDIGAVEEPLLQLQPKKDDKKKKGKK